MVPERIWVAWGREIQGHWRVPLLRRLRKTYAPHMATAPWAKSTTPVERYFSTMPRPSRA
jgi:hypothetical protein